METIKCSSVISNPKRQDNRLSIQREISFINSTYEPYKRWSTVLKFGKDGTEARNILGDGQELSVATTSSSSLYPKMLEKVEIVTIENGNQVLKQTIEFNKP